MCNDSGPNRVTARQRLALDGAECLVEVRPQVLEVLDPDGEPDQVLGHGRRLGAEPAPAFEARLDAAEAGGRDPQPNGGREGFGRVQTTARSQGDDGAEPRHLAGRAVVWTRPKPS